jgi:ribonuclease D
VTAWIRTPEALGQLARSLAGGRAFGLDTESDSLFHHFEKVCLVQIATEDGDCYLVDTLVVRDLSPLAPIMADPSLVKVLHGADYDVTTLKRDFAFTFASLFDTMIAARLLGRPELGLAAVARDELGVSLSKDNQKDDWSRRPLTPQQEAYAAADVAHLVTLQQRLASRLESLGRLGWLREECDAVAALGPAARQRDPDAYLSIKGAKRLAPRALAALRELVAWRERRAQETDLPAFKILGNEVLLRLAELPPGTGGLAGSLPPRLRPRKGEIAEALARAHALDEGQLPVVPRFARPILPDQVLRRIARLKAWRTVKAAELKVDVSVVLPQRLIDKLAEASPRDGDGLGAIEGLRRWRSEAFGREILAAL